MEFPKDKDGKDLHIEDIVSIDGNEYEIVTMIENNIQVIPLGAGIASIIDPKTVTLVSSFINDIISLATNNDLKQILLDADNRVITTTVRTSGSKMKATQAIQEVLCEL